MSSEYIINVTETSFEYEVITYSQNVPVIVDFWATWCKPCAVLEPLLERIVIELGGSIRMARVDVDANPNLALRFSVRSIPTIKAFVQGRVVGEFAGVQPEARIREFIEKIIPPDKNNLALEKATALLEQRDWEHAESIYRELLNDEPGNPPAMLGLMKSVLGQGRVSEALTLFHNFPASREYNDAEVLKPLIDVMYSFEKNSLPDQTDVDVMFSNCLRLTKRGNYPAALDGMLDILRQNKQYRQGLVRKVFLAILEMMGEDDPQTRQYRSELASVLF